MGNPAPGYNFRGQTPPSYVVGSGGVTRNRLVKFGATVDDSVIAMAATTDMCAGVALTTESAAGVVAVQQRGRAIVVASAAITKGDELMFATGGKVATATGSNTVIGYALQSAAADGDEIAAELICPAVQAP